MPRQPREKSKSGIYHIVLRGANKQEIFHDDEDRRKFLESCGQAKFKSGMTVLGWCLMNNHVHLLLEEGMEDISISMKRLGVSYVWYYNQKYKTTGHLFQGRFKSEAVETERYLLAVLRYIHHNPLKAKIVNDAAGWRWSSCPDYYGIETVSADLLDRDRVLELFSGNKRIAAQQFKEFNEQKTNDHCLDETSNERLSLSDDAARSKILKLLSSTEMAQVKSLPKKERDQILREIKSIKGISQRQAARILGISASLLARA